MLENKEGQKVPSVKFKVQEDNEWEAWSTDRLFANKKVIVFSLPGAFTPTCSSSHLPRYNELAPVFKTENIDAIFCISVNDTFVMNAWKKDQDA
ncbi:MAG: redoxin family protein, partial [Gammaproteobacteria bacterium]|nr:redoxin family protein [Gammaproteobacteria bacterium]